MIDINVLRDDPDRVRASQRARGEDEAVVDAVLAADRQRRTTLAHFESARARQKQISKDVGALMGRLGAARKTGAPAADLAALEAEADAARAAAAEVSAQVKDLESAASTAQAELDALARTIPNVIVDGIPAGGEDDYVVLATYGTPRDFAAEGFEPKDHVDVLEGLGGLDLARGVKVAQSRFYYLVGPGARLESALMNLALAKAHAWGFVQLSVPTLVNPAVMAGAGFLDAHADEVYRLAADDLYLTGTSEVALAGYHAQEIVDLSAGPKRYVAPSTCYRREAGTYGKDTRGIIRVHQFQKVEMFLYCRPEDAVAEHERLLSFERDMLDAMELPYRVIDVAAGDLGGPAARKFDCEAWVPTQGKYREVTSTSNCTTYQARRLNIRERGEGGTRIVATLNGTLTTSPRWLVPLLENHQQADGSVAIPAALQPYLGTDRLTPPGT
ncbi:MAG: serine--tRNA ligase [Austwickia sp.]|nr:serine--tRNA ligase [Austwickia sp.]MBK8437090.1 serine--tRNA ligase [Austwickia sp.]MBK9102325.1 serine--tRNA ligase [Austwickia sp.]